MATDEVSADEVLEGDVLDSELVDSVGAGQGDDASPAVADDLLGPLVDTAGGLVAGLEANELPRALRTLAGFDRRGLSRAAARTQMLRAVLDDATFRTRVIEAFLARPEVGAVLEQWTPDDVGACVDAAAARDDLELLASVLYAARPPRWEFGLGFVASVALHRSVDRDAEEELRVRDASIAVLEEARTRADETVARLEREVAALAEDLRSERSARREREERAKAEADEAGAIRDAALKEAEVARVAADDANAARERQAQRLAKLEGELRDLRAAGETPRAAPRLRSEDAEALIEAASLARRLASGLEGVAQRARRDAPRGAGPSERTPRRSRARVPVPGGLVLDSRDGLDGALRVPGVVLLVDGYNVSMKAWADAPIAQQRERLVAALSGLQARTKASVTVVFDGADVGVRPARSPGVRVVFSPEGVEADTVVIDEVRALALDVPAIVVSSDRAVAEGARSAGAGSVASPTLISLFNA